MTEEIAKVWLDHLRQQLEGSPSFAELEQRFSQADEALADTQRAGLLKHYDYLLIASLFLLAWREATQRLRKQAKQAEHPLLEEPWLSRVRAFINDPDEPDPRTCRCDHVFQGTGVFFQSIGVIQCATCRHWQIIRKPVK